MSHTSGRKRVVAVALSAFPLAAASVFSPQAAALPTADDGSGLSGVIGETLSLPTGSDAGNPGVRVPTSYRPLHTGLDNPRQISLTTNGGLVVAEAGHGADRDDRCVGEGGGTVCVGFTGSVSVYRDGRRREVMGGLISGAGEDGSFAIGADGAGRRPGGGPYLAAMTYAPPRFLPPGVKSRQLGKLLVAQPGGPKIVRANITAFEKNNDPDGEGFDSNPYSVLGLGNQILVADAAGDSIVRVKDGVTSLWAALPDPGPRIDPVPTSISRGGNGHIYVGTLWSLRRGKARVLEYNRAGNLLHQYRGFTTIAGVAALADGTLYVSELFGGCGFDQIPQCFPGRVVEANTGGDGRSYMRIPFPAGIVARGDRVQAVAWSVAPATGFGGDPNSSGAVWRLRF
ncbi:MAG: ScyD/ScyE family protein [Nocardioidaceae bacterium]|nr:ScyD/ScyE family protein [Nocardioidaceae bacterium]